VPFPLENLEKSSQTAGIHACEPSTKMCPIEIYSQRESKVALLIGSRDLFRFGVASKSMVHAKCADKARKTTDDEGSIKLMLPPEFREQLDAGITTDCRVEEKLAPAQS